MSEQPSVENGLPACICLRVPRSETLDGEDGWIHVVDDCPQHGRNFFHARMEAGRAARVLPPEETERCSRCGQLLTDPPLSWDPSSGSLEGCHIPPATGDRA